MGTAVHEVGDVVEGRYRLLKILGEGGMGTVFLAEHALIKRRVAVKILHPDLATDANVIERFMNEARAAGTLGHPNIVESTDMGFTGNHIPYIVFEYLEGTLLTDEIYRVGGLPVHRAGRIADQIISALGAAHNAGIVHRDLKSDNVFLTDKDDALDHVKVIDFGVSRFLELEDRQRSMVVGTPEFMAPEQITAPASVDRRADIYALGIILYEMLTARRPFSGEDPRELMHRIVHEEPAALARPEVPDRLERIIMTKLLAKDPGERYQSMGDVQVALEPFITTDGAPVRRRSAPMIAVVPPSDGARDSSRTLDAFSKVALSPPEPRRAYAPYAVAAIGVLIGIFGMARGGRTEKQAAVAGAPSPVITVELDADAPNAQVLFRHRVAPAPAHLQLTATNVVELVEISAPGYKTQRYWLTFDRSLHLDAHLVKGTGLVEATDAETLTALEPRPPA